jgi:hypothetical protein
MTHLSVGYQVYPLVIFPLSELAQPAGREKWQIKGNMDEWSHSTMNSAEASDACNLIFRKVINVPYSYSEESFFFNRAMFDFDTRLHLFQLRHELTVKLIDDASWGQIDPILKEMVTKMELTTDGIGDHLINEIIFPTK